jgi:hypothetical protein
VFASEFVIRTYPQRQARGGDPVQVLEKRPPSINLFKRVPNVLTNLAKLTWANPGARLNFSRFVGSRRGFGNAGSPARRGGDRRHVSVESIQTESPPY